MTQSDNCGIGESEMSSSIPELSKPGIPYFNEHAHEAPHELVLGAGSGKTYCYWACRILLRWRNDRVITAPATETVCEVKTGCPQGTGRILE
jgi:hypothetical protein